jgi:hypothetical protein
MARDSQESAGVEGAEGMGQGRELVRSGPKLPRQTQKQRILDRMEEIKEMVGQGMEMKDIAPVIGVSLDSLKLQILLDPGAAQARAGYFAREMDERYKALLDASNGLEMSKAREALNHMRSLAKVRSKEYFGEDPGIQINIQTPEQQAIRIRQLEQELGIDPGSPDS